MHFHLHAPGFVPFKVSPQRTAKKFLRFYHATAKKFLQFPELKLKQPAISHKKNFCLWTQKEVLAHALFLGCTVCQERPNFTANLCGSLLPALRPSKFMGKLDKYWVTVCVSISQLNTFQHECQLTLACRGGSYLQVAMDTCCA